MRAMLADASLARYAGRFVWLELDFDNPRNRDFLVRQGVTYTPSLFVLDPIDERATATQLGGLTLAELPTFLERGETGMRAKAREPAAVELARGDELLGRGKSAEAAAAYREALRLSWLSRAEHDRAVASFTWALMSSKQWHDCAQTAAAEAPHVARTEVFGRIVLAGLTCANQESPAKPEMERLAAEAIALPATLRDHRFQLYQELMYAGELRGDRAMVTRWGDAWLGELDATRPVNDDERSALDVARADAASLMKEPARVLPALAASERAMQANYNASLRLAQMEIEAGQYEEAIAACRRGEAHATGPLARSWLLKTEAEALVHAGRKQEARQALQDALRSAREISVPQTRERNIESISKALKGL